VCNIAAGLAAAGLASLYDDVLTWRNAVLALFIPIVLALSESVAIQSVTLAVERRRSGSASADWLIRRGLVESLTGLFLGGGAAALVAVVAAVWLRDLRVVGVLFGAIGLGVAISALVGFLVPTLLHRLRWNPQVAAGPVSLATADMLTLLIYFNLARVVA
jgi:magnesium transporter